MANELPARITVKKACEIVGGDKPIDASTYYRGAHRGLYPKPDRAAGSRISRVNTDKLLTALKLNETK
jgi:hypothetical protein